MAFNNIRHGDNPFAYDSLRQWAKELRVPARSLLHHSAHGHLPVFALPPHGVDYYAAHENSFESISSAPAPISITAQGAMGLVLADSDIAKLAAGKLVEVSRFNGLMRKNYGWPEITPPTPDRSDPSIRDDGWRIVAYRRAQAADASENTNKPLTLKITPSKLYVRNIEVAQFAQQLLAGQFVADLIVTGKVVEDLPPYVSEKLQEMVDANRLYWHNHLDIDIPEKERRQVETWKYLNQYFLEKCDKKTRPDSLLSFAADACDPSGVPATQRLGASSVTPDLQAMLTAAKLFWAPYCSYEASRATYPEREFIVDFLRFMGVRQANMASSATTIIRPESVNTPSPERRLSTLLRPRQASRR